MSKHQKPQVGFQTNLEVETSQRESQFLVERPGDCSRLGALPPQSSVTQISVWAGVV